MHDLFIKNLQKMDFDPTDKEFRSVVLVSERNDKTLHFSQIIALEEAEKFNATAVYFRLFPEDENRSPLSQIYIYDNSQNQLSQEKIVEIHRDLWSSCRIPMFIVIDKTNVKIFDTRKPVTVSSDNKLSTSPIDKINFVSEAIKLYSRELFDKGIFWETEKAKNHFKEEKSAYKLLIKDMNIVRDSFLESTNLPEKTANKLLVFSILIKYLEERGDENETLFSENETLFAKDFFQKFDASKFCDVLRQKGKIVTLFEELSQHFNGKIFEWEDENEKKEVVSANLEKLADFLDADVELKSGQGYLWRKYSFNHLPVELISTVYESFLNKRKDAVYTPEFLVNTLVDQSMPQSDIGNLSVKTIDISCGSGIFLVSAFKRLVQRQRYAEFKKNGELKPLKSKKLLKIIKDNIFGVDIEEDAVRLTVFSLCLALCDELTPKEIWTELKFDDTFQTNFKQQNFFEYIETTKNFGKYDLVIGNPPFISLTIKGEKDENGKYIGKYKEKDSNGKTVEKVVRINDEIYKKTKKNIFPNNQTALMFLDLSSYLLKENGLLCLIMPSAPLLYNNSFEFRKHFLPKHQVSQIWDFTSLDAVLFGTAKVPTAAISARKQPFDEATPITHVTVRRTKSVEQKIFFEIDKYDFHYVSQQRAINDKHVWKCNLLGGGRLNDLIERLSNINSIGTLIEEYKWNIGDGFKVYKGNDKPLSADYIYEKPMIPTEFFFENGIDETKIIINETDKLFERPRKKELYSPPHLLIKKNIGINKIPTYFSDNYLTFKDSIIGISTTETEREELLKLSKSFEENKKLYKLLITATSNKYLVKMATVIQQQDIMNLPYSEDKEEMQLSYVEQILCDDVLNYQIELISKGSKAKVNEDAKIKDLRNYAEVFNKLLNSVYGKSGKSFYLKKIYDLRDFYITEFNYGENMVDVEIEKRDEPTEHIKSLAENAYSSNVSIIRVLKLYEKNKVYFIKPKALRYWLRSTAIKDADEVFSDSLTQFIPNV
jgi:methylase of polypeptide subunit release factors